MAEEVEQLELERDEVQELPMLLRPGSVGDGGAEDPEEHEQLSAGTAGRGRNVDAWGRVHGHTRARLAKYGAWRLAVPRWRSRGGAAILRLTEL